MTTTMAMATMITVNGSLADIRILVNDPHLELVEAVFLGTSAFVLTLSLLLRLAGKL